MGLSTTGLPSLQHELQVQRTQPAERVNSSFNQHFTPENALLLTYCCTFSEMGKQRQEMEVTWLAQGHSAGHWPNCTWAPIHTSLLASCFLPPVLSIWLVGNEQRQKSTFHLVWFSFLISLGAYDFILVSWEQRRAPNKSPNRRTQAPRKVSVYHWNIGMQQGHTASVLGCGHFACTVPLPPHTDIYIYHIYIYKILVIQTECITNWTSIHWIPKLFAVVWILILVLPLLPYKWLLS